MISFVLFPQAWLPSMNLNISKLVYWEVRKYEIMPEIIEEMMEHYTEVSLDVLQYINHNNTLFVIIISKTAITCEENKKELIIRNTWIKVSNLRIMGVYDVTTSSRTVHKSEMSFRTELLKFIISVQSEKTWSVTKSADHWWPTWFCFVRQANKMCSFLDLLDFSMMQQDKKTSVWKGETLSFCNY